MKAIKFKIEIKLLTPMLGTVPKDPKVYKTYIEGKKPSEITEDESKTVPEKEGVEEKGWTGFHLDDKGLFVYDYFIKGYFKHAGNVLKEELKVKALRSKLDDFLFVSPRRIYLGKEEPDGVLERPLRAMTAQGPRVSLARSDSINAGTVLSFEALLLAHKDVKPEMIPLLLEYGKLQGLGQFRNGGYGRFEVVSIEKTEAEA